jgi:hypothetical protein
MKLSELFEAVEADKIEPITIKASGDNSFIINSAAKRGMTLDTIWHIFKAFVDKKGVTLKSKAGLELNAHRMLKNRPNGFIITFEKPDGQKEKLEAALETAIAKTVRETKANAIYKAKAPQRKIEASKAQAVYRQQDKEERDKKYGKGTWARVTYKQEGGDDGYQYVLRIDGKAVMNGLTRYAAEGEKFIALAKIAKAENLGEYATKK